MGSSASTMFVERKPEITMVQPAPKANTRRPQQPVPPRDHTLEDIACLNHLDTIKYYNEETGDVFCEKCFEEGAHMKDNEKIYDIEEFVSSFKFKQIEVRTKHEFDKKKNRMHDELNRAGDYKKRVENKRRHLHGQVLTFEHDLQVLVGHLGDELKEKVSDVLDEKSGRKTVWLNELKAQLEHAQRLSQHRDTIKNKSAALRLKALLDYQTAIRSVKTVEDESTDPEDLKLDINVGLTLKDILGERNMYRAVELGDFVEKEPVVAVKKAK